MQESERRATCFLFCKYSWLICTIPLLILMLPLTIYAWIEGDPDRLLHGVDVSGVLCTGDTPYAYFPKPTNSTNVVFCVPGCPLTTTPEAICSHDRSFQCYDSYPSKPYYGYCLPAASDKREAVLSYLRDSDFLFTNVLADIHSSFFGEEWRLMVNVWTNGLVLVTLMLYNVYAFEIKLKRPLWCVYGVALLSILGSCSMVCCVFYTEPERSNSRLCDSYASVEMADCHESYPWYTAIFYYCVVNLLMVLSLIGNKSPVLHRGLMFIYAACADSKNKLRSMELLLIAYCLGVGIMYLGFLAVVYLGSCWEGVLRVLPDEYQTEVQGRDFGTVTRALIALPVVTMCLCLFEVSRLLWINTSMISPENSLADGVNGREIRYRSLEVDSPPNNPRIHEALHFASPVARPEEGDLRPQVGHESQHQSLDAPSNSFDSAQPEVQPASNLVNVEYPAQVIGNAEINSSQQRSQTSPIASRQDHYRKEFIKTVRPYSNEVLETFSIAVRMWLFACALYSSTDKKLHFVWVPAACVDVLACFSGMIVKLTVVRIMDEAIFRFLEGENADELTKLKNRLGFPVSKPLEVKKAMRAEGPS